MQHKHNLPLLVILKQRFFRFINKAISYVAKVSIRNLLSICTTIHHHILSECDNTYDMSANDIDHAWQSNLSNANMANVYSSPEMSH